MNCDWTEKISLLIDGELAREEARRAEAHLTACAACRVAQEDFLLLRQRITSYPLMTDRALSQQVLESILASKAGARLRRGVEADTGANTPAADRRGWLADAFRVPHFTPVTATVLAAALVVACGFLFYLNSRQAVQTAATNAPRVDVLPIVKPQEIPGPQLDGGNGHIEGTASLHQSASANDPAVPRKATLARGPRGMGNPKRRDNSSSIEKALVPRPHPELPSAVEDETFAALDPDVEATREPQGQTARHVEQAQLLLRSFRNARPASRGFAADIAGERERSQKLLYRNILLRREAARAGNAPLEDVLTSLEPILIDIANLPDQPVRDDVRPITERIQKKHLVAMLQINQAAAARSF